MVRYSSGGHVDHLGTTAALTRGDFDNDGYGDLAVGLPGERLRRRGGAARIHHQHLRLRSLIPYTRHR
ncbi:FG-GAP repeat protein [Actinoplanes sp. NPDC048988]|uniref:FG-GAP repeat protein n=1 Tax=Actinoplanes sp. NPDC048988 TaxID=3363901 RepID=UPI00371DB77F